MRKQKAPTEIKCKFCGARAKIYVKEGMYFVYCPTCQSDVPLKTYNMK